ncbi:MAG TPA: hypothetical protein VGK47_14975 [Nitrososphaeraceae archaeon]
MDDICEENFCYHCHDKQYKLSEVKHFMEEVVKQVYVKDSQIDEEVLDNCLSEICHYLSIKLPNQMPQIVRKSGTVEYLSEWKDYNNNFLNTLVKKEG